MVSQNFSREERCSWVFWARRPGIIWLWRSLGAFGFEGRVGEFTALFSRKIDDESGESLRALTSSPDAGGDAWMQLPLG